MFFEKVSIEEWRRAMKKWIPEIEEEDILLSYDNIKLPEASTKNSAGHDFVLPFDLEFVPEIGTGLIPTGIRWVTEDNDTNVVLIICPRSGLGVKYGMRLKNTVGIIDPDYYKADNEGHIMASIECSESFELKCGDRFIQGIIMNFNICAANDNERSGGFGSTGN